MRQFVVVPLEDCKSGDLEYLQEQLPNDLGRIDSLFQKALEAGINVQVCAFSVFLLKCVSAGLLKKN